MDKIGFPVTHTELTEMRKDGDKVSLRLSYACIGCAILSIILFSVALLCEILKVLAIIMLTLAGIFLFAVYYYRPKFMADKDEKLSKLCEDIEDWIIEIRKHMNTDKRFTLKEISNQFLAKKEDVEICIKRLSDRNVCYFDNLGDILIGPTAGLKPFSPYHI